MRDGRGGGEREADEPLDEAEAERSCDELLYLERNSRKESVKVSRVTTVRKAGLELHILDSRTVAGGQLPCSNRFPTAKLEAGKGEISHWYRDTCLCLLSHDSRRGEIMLV
jgi:hypothetical protein